MNPNSNILTKSAAAAMASRALGFVAPASQIAAPPPNIAERQFGVSQISIQGGTSFPLTQSGDYVYILTARTDTFAPITAGTLFVKTSAGDTLPMEVFQRGYRFARPFKSLEIINTAGSGLIAILRLYVGFGTFQNDSSDSRQSPVRVDSNATFGTANTAVYGAGENVGGLLTFDNFAKFSGFGGIIRKATLTLNSNASVANSDFTLYLFHGTPTFTIADRTAFGMDGASVRKLTGIINFPALENFTALGVGVDGLQACFCMVDGLEIQYLANYIGTTGPGLRGALVANGAFDPDTPVTWNLDLAGEAYLSGYVEPNTVYLA